MLYYQVDTSHEAYKNDLQNEENVIIISPLGKQTSQCIFKTKIIEL